MPRQFNEGKEQSFQQMSLGQLDIHMQKNEVRPLLQTIYKNYSKWIKDLNVGAKTIIYIKQI